MPHSIQISDETFARMQTLAVPLVDTPDTIILRALAALEAAGGATEPGSGNIQSFNPAAPPSLAHTTLKSATLAGVRLERGETSWNNLMIATIRKAHDQIIDRVDLALRLRVNSFVGRKEDSGYKYIDDVGLSVQGQDANSAWRQTYELAAQLGLTVEAEFVWQENPKAALPGISGRLSIGAPS